MTDVPVDGPAAPAPAEHPQDFARRAVASAIKAAWMAVVAGFVIQVLVLGAKISAGGPFPGAAWIADLSGGISWSLLVCGGVALGTAAAKAREALMGTLGLIAAPFAFAAAKGMQRGMQSLMALPLDKITAATWTIGGIKAVEYGVLGALVAWMLHKEKARAWHYAALGAGVGAVFGGAIVFVTATQTPAKLPALVGAGVNELIFPTACAMILFAAGWAGKHVTVLNDKPSHAEPSVVDT